MKQEDKELLLTDLCGRLPYGVKFLRESWNYEWDQEMSVIEVLEDIDKDGYINNTKVYKVEDIKPYLRPKSSMTEDELQRYHELCDVDEAIGVGSSIEIIAVHDTPESLDYLNSIHVDYRGLVPKGLAKSTEEFNPYK